MSFIFASILLIFTTYGHTSPIVNGKDCGNTLDPIQCSSNFNTSGINRRTGISPEFPYMVYIDIQYSESKGGIAMKMTCGGIILENDIVLTAAHCLAFEKHFIGPISVVTGIKDLTLDLIKSVGQVRQVKAYKVHEDFVRYSKKSNGNIYFLSNDLVILWLNKPFDFSSTVQKAKLPKKFNIKGEFGIAIGWGNNENGDYPIPLQRVELKVLKNSKCHKVISNISITDYTFCGISEDGKRGVSCGDSGGPFIINDIVYGLVSFGRIRDITRASDKNVFRICDVSLPQVFTNLYKYTTWIKKSVKLGPPTKLCSKYEKECALQL